MSKQFNRPFGLAVFDSKYRYLPLVWDAFFKLHRIPASFEKVFRTIWFDIVMPRGQGGKHCQLVCRKTYRQLGVDPHTAIWCVAALEMSGFFSVDRGKRDAPDQPGTPTVFKYRPDATAEEWLCFARALSAQISRDKQEHLKPPRKHSEINEWQFCLAVRVNEERGAVGLPLVNRNCIEWGEALLKRLQQPDDTDGQALTYLSRFRASSDRSGLPRCTGFFGRLASPELPEADQPASAEADQASLPEADQAEEQHAV